VHLNGSPVRSCSLPISVVANADIRTIEGLENQHPLQKAWIEHQVPQCGYCQSGQIMQASALLATNANPSEDEIVAYMSGNLCRCMTYSRIKAAIQDVATQSDSVVQIYNPKTKAQRTVGGAKRLAKVLTRTVRKLIGVVRCRKIKDWASQFQLDKNATCQLGVPALLTLKSTQRQVR
jgi:isoquinoline 1-oxidoreductase alpha subunit